jgi:hypothetical protein
MSKAILAEGPEVMAKIRLAQQYGYLIDEHAPGLRGTAVTLASPAVPWRPAWRIIRITSRSSGRRMPSCQEQVGVMPVRDAGVVTDAEI